jgi:pyruvate dehydrogenase E1 component alpha subunit
MAVANEVERKPTAKPAPTVAGATTGGEVSSPNGSAAGNGQHAGTPPQIERDRLRMMMLIRKFEEQTFVEFQKPGQKIGGFCHLYSGQEAITVGIAAVYQKNRDYLINGYRCHGHSLALGMDPRKGMAELFGKATGCSKGKGGSMHFFDAAVGNMGGHGIVGGHIPLGLGLAFAQNYKKTGGATFCLFGDGAINQGTHNEALNMASLLKAPVIFIVENNGVAMGTQVERASADPDLAMRASGYRMPHYHIDGNDLDVVISEMGKAVDRARSGGGPSYIVADTYRFRGHSMSDAMKYRTKDELDRAKQRDPISIYEVRLREKGILTEEQIAAMDEEIREMIKEVAAQADADPHPPMEDRFNDILAESYPYKPE